MKHLRKLTRKKLAEVILDEGLVTSTQLADAEEMAARSGEPLAAVLVGLDYVLEWDLARTVAAQYQLPFLELGNVSRSREVDTLLTEEEKRRERCIPIEKFGDVVTLGVTEIPAYAFLQTIAQRSGLTPFLYVVRLGEIDDTLGIRGLKPSPDEAPAPAPPDPRPDRPEGAGVETIPDFDPGRDWETIFDSGNQSVLKEKED